MRKFLGKIWTGAKNILGLGDKGGLEVTVVMPGITPPTTQADIVPTDYKPYIIAGAAVVAIFLLRR